MRKLFTTMVMGLLICAQASAASSVWKVEKGRSVMYLGGTFHMLRPADFPLPPEFDQAYADSELLVFETDIGQFNDPATQGRLMAQALYTDGATIDQYLSPQTFQQLQEFCDANQVPPAAITRFKPSMLAITLTMVELGKLGVAPEGVDTFMYQQGQTDGKEIEGLETVDQQIQYVIGMGENNEDEFILHTLEDLQSIQQEYKALVAAWAKGDDRELYRLMANELKTEMPELYQELLLDRNADWLPQIEAYLKTPQKEFVLVGVAHLVGPDGIIATLKKKGYQVKQL